MHPVLLLPFVTFVNVTPIGGNGCFLGLPLPLFDLPSLIAPPNERALVALTALEGSSIVELSGDKGASFESISSSLSSSILGIMNDSCMALRGRCGGASGGESHDEEDDGLGEPERDGARSGSGELALSVLVERADFRPRALVVSMESWEG